MTMKAKSSPPATPGGDTANASLATRGSWSSTVATIASRQVSVRVSAQRFHMPAAQFSVSKNQLMPNTGDVAATKAAAGRPIWRPRLNAAGSE